MKVSFSKILIISTIVLLGFGIIPLNAVGESGIIPTWIKNNAGWWYEDKISETEYITSIQYLIDEGIIKVNSPITEVFATDSLIVEEQRAHSFEVHVDNHYLGIDDTYYSFVQFFNRNEASGQPNGVLTGSPDSPEFVLGSLPSQDKKKLYQFVGKSIEPGGQIERLETFVDVSVLDANGQAINTWKYRDCLILDYLVFLDSDKDEYRWGEIDSNEIREIFVFKCRGLDIIS